MITVRLGQGERLHAASEDGRTLCYVATSAVIFRGSSLVKVADGTQGVTCRVCLGKGLTYSSVLPGLTPPEH
jgi:hypothetical protein